jgi:hypothetical protein
MVSNHKITYNRFSFNEFLCEQCSDNDSKKGSIKFSDKSWISVVRNDCKARACWTLKFCECICKNRYSDQCQCHEPLREYDDLRICDCCQICRYTSTPLLNSAELESLKSIGVNMTRYTSCTRCNRYVYHKYDNKNGIRLCNVSLRVLHRLVTQKKCTSESIHKIT